MNGMLAASTHRCRRRGAGRAAAGLWLCLSVSLVGTLGAAEPGTHQARVRVGPAAFRVELAQTEEERRRGLMFRRDLPADQGMLFIQDPGRAEFWMKNTLIALDLLYFDAEGTLLEIVPEAPPCRRPDCPTYPSTSTAVSYILEINGGEAARQAIQVGDPLGVLP